MKVTLIAHTTMMNTDWHDTPYTQNDAAWPDQLAELAGRACYESWHRPNPATNTNDTYLAHIIESEHFSVLEHASASFYVTGVSRSLLAELTRHRHLSFSVRSQRYVDEARPEYVTPPAMKAVHTSHAADLAQDNISDAFILSQRAYIAIRDVLLADGMSHKQAREAARSVLPQATETRFVVTGNMRAWRDVLRKRMHAAADAEIQNLAWEILRQLQDLAPATFQDFTPAKDFVAPGN